jgi:hypothetical protein
LLVHGFALALRDVLNFNVPPLLFVPINRPGLADDRARTRRALRAGEIVIIRA